MTPPPPVLSITALSTYALYLSYANITRLQTYEARSEKAAEWSTKAAERLRKTRMTQASAAISILLSLLTSTTLLFAPTIAPTIIGATLHSPLSILQAVILFGARSHNAAFWNPRTQVQVPFVRDWNAAVKGSEKTVRVLGVLAAAWGGVGAAVGLGLGGGEGVWRWVVEGVVGAVGWAVLITR